jgi:Chitinase
MSKRLWLAAAAAAVAALAFAGGAVARPSQPQSVRAVFFANWDRYGRGYLVNQIPADRLNDIDYAFATVTSDGSCALTDPWSDYQAPTWSGSDSVNGIADDPSNPDQHLFGNFNQLVELKPCIPTFASRCRSEGGPARRTSPTPRRLRHPGRRSSRRAST